MVFPFDLQHRRDCQSKQAQRSHRIRSLTAYHGPFSVLEREILQKPIQELVQDVQKSATQPIDVLKTYGKVALKAHESTNCLTEVMLESAEGWLKEGSINLKGPLAGIPVSLKDSLHVAGYDSCIGYSMHTNKPSVEDGPVVRLLKDAGAVPYVKTNLPITLPSVEDGPVVRLLKDAGAVPYVKTNLPITLLSFESTNDVWGRTTNPHNSKYSPGGSTGGESALLAFGGRIGIGSDVAGSVRVPAHFSGCYSLRCSTGRWPKMGITTSMPGQEGIPSVFSPMARTLNDLTYFTRSIVEMKPVFSPMARTLNDLTYFTRSIVEMKPWNYDYTVHPIPWRHDVEKEFLEKKKLRVGIMRTDGVVDPSPACLRAVEMVEDALRRSGHEIVEVDLPHLREILRVASLALNSDGCLTYSSFLRPGEWVDAGAAQLSYLASMWRMWRPTRYLYYLWVKYVRRDALWADLVRDFRPQSAFEAWKLVSQREKIRLAWFDWWEAAEVDFLVTPPNATPAVPHDGMGEAVSSCGYTFMFNLLDYSAGVVPVTHVDKNLDQLPKDFKLSRLNGVARGAYKLYDATAMHGLPVGVQVVGRRLEEEKVLSLMQRVEDALGDDKYELLEID
ncbi:putative amidase PB8B6.03 like protein [Verticillium longisporum]|uniref:Putative amidase PB8B6.03 like protein n=1 Tax=Verticillium longisporum TaxID=100787 RepID=A0A8I2Z2T3_VERLO|nr:putative amidase PB8B6.03 like protein [Verticillium longisporum]